MSDRMMGPAPKTPKQELKSVIKTQLSQLTAEKLTSAFRKAADEIIFTWNSTLFSRIPGGLDNITDDNSSFILYQFLKSSQGDTGEDSYKFRVLRILLGLNENFFGFTTSSIIDSVITYLPLLKPFEIISNVAFSGSIDDVKTLLEKAVEKGIIEENKNLLNSLCDDNTGDTLLHLAVNQNKKEVAKLLVEHGADLHQINKKKETPLCVMIKNCCMDVFWATVLQKQYKAKENIKYTIVEAAKQNKTKVVDFLLNAQKKAELTGETNIEDQYPLHWAAIYGNPDMAQSLLASDANPQKKDGNYKTAFDIALKKEHLKVCVVILKSAKYQLPEKPKALFKILNALVALKDVAATTALFEKAKNLRVFENNTNLLNTLCDVNTGDTLLYLAAKQNNKEIVKLLVEHGADPHQTNKEMDTPLCIMIMSGYMDVFWATVKREEYKAKKNIKYAILEAAIRNEASALKFLLSAQKKGNLTGETYTRSHQYPLHWAATHGNQDMAQSLLAFDADPQQKDDKDKTAFDIALEKKHLDVCVVILKSPKYQLPEEPKALIKILNAFLASKDVAATTALFEKAKSSRVFENNTNLLNTVCDVNTKDTLLHLAAKQNNKEVAKLLVEHGANPHQINEKNDTALCVMIKNDDMGIFWATVKRGEYKAKKNISYAIVEAAKQNKADVVKFLLNAQKDVTSKEIAYTADKQYPLHWAATHGNQDMAQSLLESDADPQQTNTNNKTAFDIALEKNHLKVCGVILKSSKYQLPEEPEALFKILNAFLASKDVAATTALFEKAKKSGVFEKNQDLLNRVCDVNTGDTLLHLAVKQKNQEVAKLLVEHGADPFKINKQYYTPSCLGITNQLYELVKWMANNFDGKITSKLMYPILWGVYNKHLETVKLLAENATKNSLSMEKVLTGSAINSTGNRVLHCAVINNDKNMVEFLLNYKDKIGINKKNLKGETALHLAAKNNKIELVQMLKDAGAKTSIKNTKSQLAFVLTSNEKIKALLRPSDTPNNNIGEHWAVQFQSGPQSESMLVNPGLADEKKEEIEANLFGSL